MCRSAFYLLGSRTDVVNFIKEMTTIGTATNGGAFNDNNYI